MREMKDSGIEWIGEIPKDWERGCIKNILEVLTDYTANGSFADLAKNVHYLDNDGFARLVRLTDLRLDLSNDDGVYVGEKTYNYLAKSSLFGGEILVANVGAYAGLFCEMPPKEGRFTLGPNMFLLRTNKRMIQHYLFYLGQAKFVKEQLAQKAISSAQPKLNKTDLKTVFIAIPSIAEQQQIADYLDTQCSEIDATAEDIQKEITLLEDYKKSVITEAVTIGLNPDAEMKDSGIEYIGITPIHWNKYRLKYILLERNIRTTTGEEMLLSVSQYKGVVPSKDINNRTMQANSLIGYKIVKKDDLVFNKLNPGLARFGNSEFDGITSPDFSVYIVDDKKCTAKFLQHLLKTYKYVAKIKGDCTGVGDGFARLYSEQLYRFVVSLPPIEELHSIVAYIDSKSSEIDSLIVDKKRQLDILADYKKSLIYEYVTGKKEVPVNE